MAPETHGKLVEGVWLPKQEQHLTEWMTKSKGAHRIEGVITYQWAKQEVAQTLMRKHVPDYKNKQFVDVGAHVGLWSMWWAPIMPVMAFEPIPAMRELYRANMVGRGPYRLYSEALSNTPGFMELAFNPENTGNTHMKHAHDGDLQIIQAPVTTLDFKFKKYRAPLPIGVIKIDCEGSEHLVVLGSQGVIRRYRPLIIVEQKKGAEYYGVAPTAAVSILENMGYMTAKVMSGDYIMLHRDCA